MLSIKEAYQEKNRSFFVSKPTSFSKNLCVVASLHLYQGQILLLLRHPDKADPLTWAFPGGKVEGQESLLQAIQREVKEETGVEMEPSSFAFLQTFYILQADLHVEFHLFSVIVSSLPSIELNKQEHIAYGWFDLKELKTKEGLIPGLNWCLQNVLPSI